MHSSEYTIYKLTENGWKPSEWKTDFNEGNIPINDKVFESVKYTEEQSSPFSKLQKSLEIISTDSNQVNTIQNLKQEFGECPRTIYTP